MDRLDLVLSHPLFRMTMEKITEYETDRQFCCHRMDHLADVSRIAYIIALEEQLKLEKEIIYIAAYLHDIGRYRQYAFGESHHLAGVSIAEEILADIDISETEKMMILNAIRGHRDSGGDFGEDLSRIIYQADKKSRLCFMCHMIDACYWSDDAKNMHIIY